MHNLKHADIPCMQAWLLRATSECSMEDARRVCCQQGRSSGLVAEGLVFVAVMVEGASRNFGLVAAWLQALRV